LEEPTRSLSEVAGAMGVSERTVRRWIKSGRLKAYKPGRDYRIPEAALRQFIEESEVRPKAEDPPSLELSFNDLLGEERRALACVRSWLITLEYYSERLEELASSGKFDRGKYDASGPELTGIMTGLNTMLSELRSWGLDPGTGLIGEELGEALLHLGRAQRAADNADAQVRSEDEVAQRRERRSVEYGGNPEEVVRSMARQ